MVSTTSEQQQKVKTNDREKHNFTVLNPEAKEQSEIIFELDYLPRIHRDKSKHIFWCRNI